MAKTDLKYLQTISYVSWAVHLSDVKIDETDIPLRGNRTFRLANFEPDYPFIHVPDDDMKVIMPSINKELNRAFSEAGLNVKDICSSTSSKTVCKTTTTCDEIKGKLDFNFTINLTDELNNSFPLVFNSSDMFVDAQIVNRQP